MTEILIIDRELIKIAKKIANRILNIYSFLERIVFIDSFFFFLKRYIFNAGCRK